MAGNQAQNQTGRSRWAEVDGVGGGSWHQEAG